MTDQATDDQAIDTAVEDDATDQDQSTDDQQSDDQADDDGLDDWEDEDGNVHRVPKALKEGHLKNADYTHKTQELAREKAEAAALKASLAEQREAVQKQDQFVRAHAAEVAKFGAADHRYKEYAQWINDNEGLTDEYGQPAVTPADYNKLRNLEKEAGGAYQALTQLQQTAAVEAQREDAKAQETMRAVLSDPKTGIPGYSPKLEQEIATFAVADLGYQPEEVAAVRDPRAVKVLHLAMMGKKATAKTSAAKTVQAQQATAPAPTLGGRTPPTAGLSDKLSAEEWDRRRKEQLRKRAGR